MTPRPFAALGAVLFALVGLSACGGGGIPGNAVVQVDKTPISKVAFEHWISVAAVSNTAGTLLGKQVAPKPPEYTACVAHLQELASTELAAKKIKVLPTRATSKAQCVT